MVEMVKSVVTTLLLLLFQSYFCVFGQGQNSFYSQQRNIPIQVDGQFNKGSYLQFQFVSNLIQMDENKQTFLCFLVTKEIVQVQNMQSVYKIAQYSSIDFQNCMLQLDQTALVELDENTQKVYINPIFIDELKVVNFSREIPIQVFYSTNIIKKESLCQQVCNGGTCNAIKQPFTYLSDVCNTCSNNQIGQTCQFNFQEMSINNQYQFTFQTKKWKFIRVQVNIPVKLDQNYHMVIVQTQSILQQNFIMYYSQQMRFMSNKDDSSAPINGFDQSMVRNSNSIIDELFTKEYIASVIQSSSEANQNQFNNTYQAVFYIYLFNNDYRDVNVEFSFFDDKAYAKYQIQNLNLFDLPTWVFYLMMGFAIMFFIAILCLVKALVKRYQEEQNERGLLNRRNLEKLTPEVVESHIPKYTFKHIFKAVKKRRDEILKECQIEQNPSEQLNEQEFNKKKQEQEEIRRKVQERCENILGNGECGICLCNFEYEDECRLTICDHIFHISCFDPWLYKNQNCPYCRTQITEAALKEWKLKTQKYYPLDQSLRSVQTIDSKKLSKSEDVDEKDKQQNVQQNNDLDQQKKDINYDGEAFSADLVKKDVKNFEIEMKPIYFHTLSLQSLKLIESPNKLQNNRSNKKHATAKIEKDTIKTLENYFNKSQNQDKQEIDLRRKKVKANTFISPTNQSNPYDNEPKSAHLGKILRGHEQYYQDTFATVNQDSPENFISNPQKAAFDFKQNLNNINEVDNSEASTRIRQDSNLFSINDPFSHNKLFQNHDSSSKLSQNGNYNLNSQDSILKIGMIESPRVDSAYEKKSKSSKFKLSQRGLGSNQDLQSIIDLDNEEKDNNQESNNKLQAENKIGQVEKLIQQQQNKEQQFININLKKQQSANLDFINSNFFKKEKDKQNDDQNEIDIKFIKSQSQKSQTLTSFSPKKKQDHNQKQEVKSNTNIENLKFN